MVEGYAHITVKGVTKTIRLDPLECARIHCQYHGWDVDAEPTGIEDRWKVTATAFNGKASISKTGTLHGAVTALIEAI